MIANYNRKRSQQILSVHADSAFQCKMMLAQYGRVDFVLMIPDYYVSYRVENTTMSYSRV